MAQIFRGVLGPFFDEAEAINPSEDFEVFFSAFQAKKPLSLQEIDNELGDIMELADIPRGFNEAMFSFLKKNAESTIVVPAVPAITPVVVPAVSAPVVVPAPITPIEPVVPAAVSVPAVAIEPVVPTVSTPAVAIEPVVPAVSAPVTVPVEPVTTVTPAITTVVPAAAPVVVIEPAVPVEVVTPVVPAAERKVKLAEVIAFVRKHRTNPEFSALVDFPVTLSNHLLPDNETHEILRQGLNLTEYVGTTVAFQAMIEDIIAKFPDVKNNMTQSAMIQGLISPNEREQVKTLYQGFHIPRPEKKLTKKRKADTQDESGEAGTATVPNGKRPYKKRAPAKNIIKNDDRVMATLDMMYRQVGTMYELLGNLLQRGPPVSAPSSQEEMDLDA